MNTFSSFFKKIYFNFIDFLLPPSEIETMTTREFASRAKTTARLENIPSYVTVLFSYRNTLVRRAVWELKYRGNKKIAFLLGSLLHEAVQEKAQAISHEKIFIIPIPSSAKRFREKGFNQTHFLGEAIQKLDTENIFLLHTSILLKTKETKTQVSVRNRSERLKNMVGAFTIAQNKNVNGAIIFLIDDVTTTGGTFSEARDTLLKAGAKKVLAFAIAH